MCFCLFFVSTLFPPKRGISPKRKRGITSTANNHWTEGYFGPGFVQGGRPGQPRFFDTPPDPVGLLLQALDQILCKKIVKMGFVCVWGRPEAPGGWRRGESVCWVTAYISYSKKKFKPWERFPTKCRRYSPPVVTFPLLCVDIIPSPLSAYGVAMLFPLPFKGGCEKSGKGKTVRQSQGSHRNFIIATIPSQVYYHFSIIIAQS
jgi:hypothetical protein